jgi:ABC-type transport system substrate-binding protein
LKAAGYGVGNVFSIKLSTVAEHKELAEYFQKKWGEVGVNCEIEINQAPAHQEMVDNGRSAFFMKSWLRGLPGCGKLPGFVLQ